MPRPEKVAAVAEIKERIEASEAVFVTEFRGLSVKQIGALRRSLRDLGADYKVVKMSLARRATDELGLDELSGSLVGPSAIAFAKTDPVATAKVLRDLNKENELFVLKGGLLSGKVIKAEDIKALADIEPREVLLAKIAGAAKAPLYRTAGLMASFTRNAATMFSQLLDKKGAGADPVPAAGAPAEAAAAPEAPVEEVPAVEPEPAGEAPTAQAEQAGDGESSIEDNQATEDDDSAPSAEEE